MIHGVGLAYNTEKKHPTMIGYDPCMDSHLRGYTCLYTGTHGKLIDFLQGFNMEGTSADRKHNNKRQGKGFLYYRLQTGRGEREGERVFYRG